MNDPFNPYQPPAFPEHPATVRVPRSVRLLSILKIAIVLQMAAIVIGLVASFIDVESIVITGPVLTVLGLITLFLAVRTDVGTGFVVGISGPAIAVLCFALIYSQNWSPGDASRPIPLIGTAYAFAAVPLCVVTFLRATSRQFLSAADARPANMKLKDQPDASLDPR